MQNPYRAILSVIVFGAVLAAMPVARAQSDQQVSVAEAARRAREQKKTSAKPEKVITNDTLEPVRPAAASPQDLSSTASSGQAGAPAPATTGTSTGADITGTGSAQSGNQQPVANASSAEVQTNAPQMEATADKSDAAALKQQIADMQKTVDLAKRALVLANEDFYSRPDFSSDDAGKAKLDAMRSDVAQKEDELAQLKAKLPAGVTLPEEKPAENPPPAPQP